MASSFFTVGHSRRTLSEFVELLRAYKIELVVDVRQMPRSRTNRQFNRETLPDDLGAFQIAYTHIPELGCESARGSDADRRRGQSSDIREINTLASRCG